MAEVDRANLKLWFPVVCLFRRAITGKVLPVQTSLTDGRIGIRRFASEDAAALHAAANESLSEICPWMRWFENTFSPADSVSWIHRCADLWEKQDAYNFAVVEVATGLFVGSQWLSFVSHKNRHANLGYWTRTSCAGRGIATAAARLIAQFGFTELGLNRIEVLVAAGNRASERISEKLGARREGILRQRLFLEGKAKDATMFGLLAEDFAKQP